MIDLNDFEKKLVVDVLNHYRRELQFLGVKGFGTIDGIVKKFSNDKSFINQVVSDR